MKAKDFYLFNAEGSSGDGPWNTVTTAQLRKIRGGMFSTRANGIPYGGVISHVSYTMGDYSDAEMQLCDDVYRGQYRYTHAPIGSFVQESYHGTTPIHTFDEFKQEESNILNRIERMWNVGLIPIVFLSPDNWTLDQMRQFEPYWRQQRWQDLVKMCVPKGYEPSIDTPNSNFVQFFEWARDVFPNALRYIHLVSNFDAPGNNDDLTPGLPTYIGNDGCWRNVAPLLHGWLVQNGPWRMLPGENPVDFQNFCDQFRRHPIVHASLRDRFVNGYANWPTNSANPGEPLDIVAGEYCSYSVWWEGLPTSGAQAWGDGALKADADGAFDSCTA